MRPVNHFPSNILFLLVSPALHIHKHITASECVYLYSACCPWFWGTLYVPPFRMGQDAAA